MVVGFFILLLASTTIALRVDPSLAFAGGRFRPNANRVADRERDLCLKSWRSGTDGGYRGIFARFIQSLLITATSLQIFTAERVNAAQLTTALAPTTDSARITAVVNTARRVFSSKLSEIALKLPELTLLSPEINIPVATSSSGPESLNTEGDEHLNDSPRFPITVAGGSKLLTTTIRPESDNLESLQNEQAAKIKKLQWWKNTGLGVAQVNDEVQDQPSNFLEKVRSLSIDWKIFPGLLGIFAISDMFQSSKQLNKIIEEQSSTIYDQEIKINSSIAANTKIITVLKIESLRLIDEVDSLIQKLDDKSLNVNNLNETLQVLSANLSNSEAASKERLIEYSYQLESQEKVILYLKSQVTDIPKQLAREASSLYKDQLEESERNNELLMLDIARMKAETTLVKIDPVVTENPSELLESDNVLESNFPQVSSSPPTSTFTQSEDVEAKQLAAENAEMKLKMSILEKEKEVEEEEEAERSSRFERRISELEASLEDAKVQLQQESVSAVDTAMNEELNARLVTTESLIEKLYAENAEVEAELALAKALVIDLNNETNQRMSSGREAQLRDDDSDAKDNLIRDLTRENDDLKQRLLSADELVFNLQQENLMKLETAKIMTKELNARLTEYIVRQESKDGAGELLQLTHCLYLMQ